MKKTPIKTTPKKRKPRKKKSTFKLFALSNILVLFTLIAMAVAGYLYNENQDLKELSELKEKKLQLIASTKKAKIYVEEQRAKYFEEKTKALEIEYVSNIDSNIYLDNKEKKQPTPINNLYEKTYKKEKVKYIPKDPIIKKEQPKKTYIEKIKKPEIEKIVKSNKPKLAIIIDDVTTKRQINNILKIGYDVNMAFLPPTPRHKSSAKIAQRLDTYMIHLPLQATSNKYDEAKTLYITDSLETIDRRIKNLKKLYPKAKFINNHTGSKFTSNKQAMDKLLKVLKKYDYTFIDSRTTAKSVAKKSAKKYGVRMLSRNIFLDNKKDEKYITKQLKKAIKIAKKNGSAIAIGHPYSITFLTLKESKHLLKGIDLVYVNRL